MKLFFICQYAISSVARSISKTIYQYLSQPTILSAVHRTVERVYPRLYITLTSFGFLYSTRFYYQGIALTPVESCMLDTAHLSLLAELMIELLRKP